MMTPQPVPIMGTDPNLTGYPMAMNYMNYGANYGPQNFIYIQDPLTELGQSSGAIIRQQVELLEAITGCESQNRYHVFLESPMGLKYAFKCSERSGSCVRCCLAPSCRPLEMIIRHVVSVDQLNNDFAKIFINVNKPCMCTCCCLCRPVMEVHLADNQEYLGKIREPCTCCDYDLEIYDAAGYLKYNIIGDCCQVGFCCGGMAKKLASIRFDIKENNSTVGNITKLSSNVGEFFTKADSYHVSFPQNATPKEKMLLIIAGLMLDYQYFESEDESSQHPHGHHYY